MSLEKAKPVSEGWKNFSFKKKSLMKELSIRKILDFKRKKDDSLQKQKKK